LYTKRQSCEKNCTVCTFRLSQALYVPYLTIVASVFVWISVAVWTAFAGLVRSLLPPAGAAGTTA
jgi:hypothetical protein